MNEPASYEFSDFRVDAVARQLFCDGKHVPLTAKAFDTLLVLIRRRGETVAKSDLMDAVWGDVAVEENNLTQQISALRKAFGERPDEHKFIVTVPGRGYSFVAPITELKTGEPQVKVTFPFLSRSVVIRTAAFAAIVLMVALILALSFNLKRSLTRPAPQTIAVLPFRSTDGSDDELGSGMRYTLTAKLGNLQEILNVRGAVSDNFRTPRDPILAGREMNVDAVLDGTIQHDGENVRVTVQMVDVAGGQVIWAKTVDAVAGGNFAIQDRVAAEIINGLREYYARD